MDYINGSSNSATTQIYTKEVLAGNIEMVRLQLIEAVESLGYDIIEEEPNIIVRRGARGWATAWGSADVLEYPMDLTLRLKSVGEYSTHVTFDYLIKHPWLNKGEKNIVVQEAKTIAAISKTHAIEKMCSVCETESTGDSKFCRRCGASLTTEHSELEVLRMMAEIRAGKTSVVVGSFLSFGSITLIAIALIFLLTGNFDLEALTGLLAVGGVAGLLALICSLFGWNRIKRSLEKPETEKRQHIPRNIPESFETGEFQELPPRQPVASVTEGTTNLLNEEWTNHREKEKIPVSKKRDTNNFD